MDAGRERLGQGPRGSRRSCAIDSWLRRTCAATTPGMCRSIPTIKFSSARRALRDPGLTDASTGHLLTAAIPVGRHLHVRFWGLWHEDHDREHHRHAGPGQRFRATVERRYFTICKSDGTSEDPKIRRSWSRRCSASRLARWLIPRGVQRSVTQSPASSVSSSAFRRPSRRRTKPNMKRAGCLPARCCDSG